MKEHQETEGTRQLVEDHRIINIWACACGEQTEVHPDFYSYNGTPVCACGDDMRYLRTEVIIPRADIPFDPTRGFDSPHAAIEYACSFGGSYEEKQQRVLLIVAFNVDQSEFGFASEVVRELEAVESAHYTKEAQ